MMDDLKEFWGKDKVREKGTSLTGEPPYEREMCFGIKDFYYPCKEFARGFDFSRYWDEFVEPLDERFPKWKYLEKTGTGESDFTSRLLPKLRDRCDGKYSIFETEVFKVVQLMTTEWVIVEKFRISPLVSDYRNYDVVQFHRVLNKLFKNKEMSAKEAIEELKKWTFEPVKVEVLDK